MISIVEPISILLLCQFKIKKVLHSYHFVQNNPKWDFIFQIFSTWIVWTAEALAAGRRLFCRHGTTESIKIKKDSLSGALFESFQLEMLYLLEDEAVYFSVRGGDGSTSALWQSGEFQVIPGGRGTGETETFKLTRVNMGCCVPPWQVTALFSTAQRWMSGRKTH